MIKDLTVQENIKNMIYTIRNQQVMLDKDLAALYGVVYINRDSDRFFSCIIKYKIKNYIANANNIETNLVIGSHSILHVDNPEGFNDFVEIWDKGTSKETLD